MYKKYFIKFLDFYVKLLYTNYSSFLSYITNILSYDNAKSYKYVVFATKNGTVKKTDIKEYLNGARKTGLVALKLREDDTLISTKLIVNEDDRIIFATKKGLSLVIDQNDVSVTGRNTIGVKGINLAADDELIAMDIITKNTTEVLSVSAKGYAKRTSIDEFSNATRATKGSLICKFKEENDYLADMVLLNKTHKELIVNSKISSLKITIDSIPLQNRTTIGVQTIKITNSNPVNDLILVENF